MHNMRNLVNFLIFMYFLGIILSVVGVYILKKYYKKESEHYINALVVGLTRIFTLIFVLSIFIYIAVHG